MNKCPRCENENLKEEYNYCPVCGLNLGTAPEVPVQEQLTLQEAKQLLLNQFKALALCNELSDTEFKSMIELYSILFPYHP